MIVRLTALSLGLVVVLGVAGVTAQEQAGTEPARPQGESPTGGEKERDKAAASETRTEKEKEKDKEKAKEKLKPGTLQQATFGGGCFWCTEAVFEQVPGVRSVVSGYAGGIVPFPTYEAVSAGMTGHAEVVQVVFDASVVSYEKLLEVFWRSHDPTTPNAQGPDVGTQYRSIILYHNEEQKKAAERVPQAQSRRVIRGVVVTELVPFTTFFPAEAYHQNYYNNHPLDPYSMVYIAPKFDVFRKMAKGAKKKSHGEVMSIRDQKNPHPPPGVRRVAGVVFSAPQSPGQHAGVQKTDPSHREDRHDGPRSHF